jgi:hypothetical protein
MMSYNAEVVVFLGCQRCVVAAETQHRSPYLPPKHLIGNRLRNFTVVFWFVFPEFPGLTSLHALHVVPQKLMRIFLATQPKLTTPIHYLRKDRTEVFNNLKGR